MQPTGVLRLLRLQGLLLMALAAVLFARPASAGVVWPWKISPFLAQLYACPLLALALASLQLARRLNWAELRIPCAGTAAFAVLALLGSALHAPLFDPTRATTAGWVLALVMMAGLNTGLAAMATGRGHAASAAVAARRRGAVA